MLRTHTCGELRKKDVDNKITLCGWVHTRRDHGGIIFIDLRDRYGFTQIVFDPVYNKEAYQLADKLRREDCIKVLGEVRERKVGMKNAKMDTGDIEVFIENLVMLNQSDVPPIEIDDRKPANEFTRLKYRYLDLRRPIMQQRIILRHKALQATREYLNSQNFLEIETPLLIRATPEGARDYVVPSRVHPGKFYSLPQSPQLYKQLLMTSGFDRYYQLARCLRDEDLREDRQPEFTQIDLEMSFAEQEDVFSAVEGVMKNIFNQAANLDVKIPFPRFSYQECMNRWGTDKPDTRFGLELINLTKELEKSDFKVFLDVINQNGIIKAVVAPGCANFSRGQIEEYISFAQQFGAKGLAWVKVTGDGLESNIVKFFNEEVQKAILEKTQAKKGDLIFFSAGSVVKANGVIAKIRLKLGKQLDLIDAKKNGLLWVVDYPLYEWDDDNNKWDAMHHPFSMPKEEHMGLLEKDPSKVVAKLYDLVWNGVELGSGSIRIHRPEIQEKVLKVIGLSLDDVKDKFGFLLDAFRYGAPPHGGFALGFDRICALLTGFNDIREVIAFPKTKSAESPMDGCPTILSAQELKDVHLNLSELAKKNLGNTL